LNINLENYKVISHFLINESLTIGDSFSLFINNKVEGYSNRTTIKIEKGRFVVLGQFETFGINKILSSLAIVNEKIFKQKKKFELNIVDSIYVKTNDILIFSDEEKENLLDIYNNYEDLNFKFESLIKFPRRVLCEPKEIFFNIQEKDVILPILMNKEKNLILIETEICLNLEEHNTFVSNYFTENKTESKMKFIKNKKERRFDDTK